MATLLVLSGVLLAAFVWIEWRAPEPIVPLGLLGSRGVGIPTLGMACMAAGLFATSLFTPLFLQGVAGQSATRSGSVLTPMMLSWVVASVLVGQLIARLGQTRPTAVGGMAVAAFGLWLMAGMGPQTDYAVVARNLVMVGLGLGSALSSFAVAAQNAVPVHQTGVRLASPPRLARSLAPWEGRSRPRGWADCSPRNSGPSSPPQSPRMYWPRPYRVRSWRRRRLSGWGCWLRYGCARLRSATKSRSRQRARRAGNRQRLAKRRTSNSFLRPVERPLAG